MIFVATSAYPVTYSVTSPETGIGETIHLVSLKEALLSLR
jgi:hypothetical protein